MPSCCDGDDWGGGHDTGKYANKVPVKWISVAVAVTILVLVTSRKLLMYCRLLSLLLFLSLPTIDRYCTRNLAFNTVSFGERFQNFLFHNKPKSFVFVKNVFLIFSAHSLRIGYPIIIQYSTGKLFMSTYLLLFSFLPDSHFKQIKL